MKTKKILIIQLQNLGDSIVFTPTLKCIKTFFPEAIIDIVTNTRSYQVYINNPQINEIYLDRGWNYNLGKVGFRDTILNILKIRKRNYDLVINDINGAAFRYNLLSFLFGIPLRLGFNINRRGLLNNLKIELEDYNIPYIMLNMHIFKQICLLNNINCELDNDLILEPEFYYKKRDVKSISGLLKNLNEKSVVISPGSNKESKTWLGNYWVELAIKIKELFNYSIIVSGNSEYENRIAIEIKNSIPDTINLVGETSIIEFAALIDLYADLVITVDSGTQHIAACFHKLTIVIMSTQDESRKWCYRYEHFKYLRREVICSGCRLAICDNDKLCMELVTPNDVLQEMTNLNELRF